MKCIYCIGELHLHKEDTQMTAVSYWYGCHDCGSRTPRCSSIALAKLRVNIYVCDDVSNKPIFVNTRIRCEYNKKKVTGIVVFDEVALCYVCQPSKGPRYPLWECTFLMRIK